MSLPRWGYATGAIVLSLWLVSPAGLLAGGKIWIQSNSCLAKIDTFTLEVALRSGNHLEMLASVAQTNLGRVANADWGASINPSKARWSLPDKKVSLTFAVEGNRLQRSADRKSTRLNSS